MLIEDRLLFIGLWSYVDDNGVGIDRHADIVADLFAHDLSVSPHDTLMRVQDGLNRLAALGVIRRYSVDGKRFLDITNWLRHQRINRPSPGRYPQYDAEVATLYEPLSESSVSPHEYVEPGAVDQGSSGAVDQGSSSSSSEIAVAIRPEVEQLLDLLDELIVANGSKAPKRNKANTDAARLLLDKDGRTVEEAEMVIRWSQQDHFWRGNILSMAKLREKFDQMRLRAVPKQRPAEVGLDLVHEYQSLEQQEISC